VASPPRLAQRKNGEDAPPQPREWLFDIRVVMNIILHIANGVNKEATWLFVA
jgi:hypothetical protein